MTISQSSFLRIAASAIATIFVGFGVNAILRPDNALAFFEWEAPTAASDKNLVDNLMVVYGVRDIFMGLAMYSTAYFGNRKALGWILIAGSGVAFADGAVARISRKAKAGSPRGWALVHDGHIFNGLLRSYLDPTPSRRDPHLAVVPGFEP